MRDYAGGKLDWLAHGLPYEGTADLIARHVRPVDTCAPETLVGDLARTLGPEPFCVVCWPDGTVVGILEEPAFRDHGDQRAGSVVPFGPTTVRASEERRPLDERMAKRGRDRILVTDPRGRLLGLYRRLD